MTKVCIPFEKVALPMTKVSIPFEKVALPMAKVSIPFERVAIPMTKVSIPSEKVALPTAKVSIPFEKVTRPLAEVVAPFSLSVILAANRTGSLTTGTLPLLKVALTLAASARPLPSYARGPASGAAREDRRCALDLQSGLFFL